ncbi:hypothetical protein P7K49_009606 [Saguinus oedipus]|uniref:Uncharacterized protein n=1 Tax=Saguinus oedipus TaxID=9490 RepID=A0ABQ9VL92_SAGOE|nr:hypothetical protein P7K49_009606 [Saguinus oedipus]
MQSLGGTGAELPQDGCRAQDPGLATGVEQAWLLLEVPTKPFDSLSPPCSQSDSRIHWVLYEKWVAQTGTQKKPRSVFVIKTIS